MKPTPSGWPRISSSIYYIEAAAAIDWLSKAFGFEVRVKIEGEGGSIEHSQLTYGEGMIMVGQAGLQGMIMVGLGLPNNGFRQSPRSLDGANTQNMMIYVDDVEAHCAQARAAGAKIIKEPETTDYGEEWWTDRGYECEDLEGHHWWFYQRLRDPKPKE